MAYYQCEVCGLTPPNKEEALFHDREQHHHSMVVICRVMGSRRKAFPRGGDTY